jgi:hypothetical protein
MVLTGVVVSELRDGSVGRVRGGVGRSARAVHRDRAEHSRWGCRAEVYTRKVSVRQRKRPPERNRTRDVRVLAVWE